METGERPGAGDVNPDIAAEAVRTGDPDRYNASLGAPAELRRGLFALYFFNIEVARAPWSSQDPGIAAIRIQWWHEAIDRISAGERPPAHPAAAELARIIQGAGLPPAALQRIVAARRQDIAGVRQQGRESFSSYIEATSAELMWLAARLLGTPAAGERVVRDFAWGAGAASFLRAAAELKRRGRFPFVMADDDLRWAVSEAERRVRSARLRRRELPPPRTAGNAGRMARRRNAEKSEVFCRSCFFRRVVRARVCPPRVTAGPQPHRALVTE